MSTLFIISTSESAEALGDLINAATTSAIMGLEVDVLFMGSGVTHLLLPPGHEAHQQLTQQLQQLEAFGVKHIYAETTSLQQHAEDHPELGVAITELLAEQLQSLVASRDSILNF